MMAAALRELTADLCSGPALRALYDGNDTQAEARWQRLAELGLFGVLAPTQSGGMGLADPDFVLLAEEAGRAALPEPLTEQAALAVPALRELSASEAAAALLPEAVCGNARCAIAHPQNPFIEVPPGVTHWLLCQPGSIRLARAAEVRTVAAASVDVSRQLRELTRPPEVGSVVASGEAAERAAARILNRAAVYGAAECLGITDRLLASAADYARERTQFGKPIGSYQAIKHHLASVAVKLEFARAVVYAAVARVAEPHARAAAGASHAKLAAGDAADLAARIAIQVHGAMGYSWELDLHFYMKRAWALQGAWGGRSFHARRLQELLGAGALALGPEHTFA